MAIIGCFGLHESLDSLRHHPEGGYGGGPGADMFGGLDRILAYFGVAFGAVVLLCGVAVIWNIRNASRRNHDGN